MGRALTMKRPSSNTINLEIIIFLRGRARVNTRKKYLLPTDRTVRYVSYFAKAYCTNEVQLLALYQEFRRE